MQCYVEGTSLSFHPTNLQRIFNEKRILISDTDCEDKVSFNGVNYSRENHFKLQSHNI